MGRLFQLDPTQGQRYVAINAATNPTDDDDHRTVDWYLESGTNYVALRVHDSDVVVTETHTEGVDVALAAGVLTAVTPWIDCFGWSQVLIHLENRGANPVTYNESR